MGEKKQIPINDGILRLSALPGEPAHLLGSRCRGCGETFFPKRVACAKCTGEDMEAFAFGQRGTVYGSTIVRVPPPEYKGPVPYAYGQVRMNEGAQLLTVFTECDLDKPLPIGTEVEMITETFAEDTEGNEIIAYKFRPVRF